jgi:hypothetical protein
MGNLSDPRVFTQSIVDIIPKTIALAAPPYSYYYWSLLII